MMNPRLRLSAILNSLRESLWFIPAVALALAVIVAEVVSFFDTSVLAPFWFETTANSARALLSAIATATLTLTGLVFSITMLVLQLTSSQLSPRVMRRFLRDRNNQVVLALFISTFTYALLAIRNIEDGDVPTFTVWIGFALAMASVVAFIHYIDHMAQSIRAATVISGIATETRARIDYLYPDSVEADGELEVSLPGHPPDRHVPLRSAAGVLTNADIDRMAEVARARDAFIALVPKVGDFVPQGAPLFRVWGHLSAEQEDTLHRAAVIGRERTMQRDVAFGLRQLVDIAERALSTGVNDPTTAVQAIDYLHDLLRALANRRLGAEVRHDDEGRVVALVGHPGWDDFVGLACDEVRISGTTSLQVHRRLRYLLEDVMEAAPPHRRNALRNQLQLLDEAVEQGLALEVDRRTASIASARGHGG